MRDKKTEDFLTENGVDFEYRERVSLGRIVVNRQAGEQIRLDKSSKPLDEEYVQRYRLFYERGAEFPALVVCKRKDGKFAMINGLHRHAALGGLGRPYVDAYLVAIEETQDAVVVSRLRRTVNLLEGRPPTPAEVEAHAIQMVVFEGMSHADSARELGLQPGRVSKVVAVEKAIADIKEVSKLSELQIRGLALERLRDINRVKHPEIKAQMAELSHAAQMSVEEVRELSQGIRTCKTDDERKALLQKWAESPDIKERIRQTKRGTRALPMTPPRKLKVHSEKIARLLSEEDLRLMKTKERREVLGVLKQLRKSIDVLIARLESGNGSAQTQRRARAAL